MTKKDADVIKRMLISKIDEYLPSGVLNNDDLEILAYDIMDICEVNYKPV